MKILAHRGVWRSPDEKNSLNALVGAFENKWGIETDIRDYRGKLIVSHDPADKDSFSFEILLEKYSKLSYKPLLALNIKADGLYMMLADIFEKYGIDSENYFVFDMSVPQQYVYLDKNFTVYTRSSEFELDPAFMTQCKGVWLDQFTEGNHILENLAALLETGKNICVVSPELHGRDHKDVWGWLHQFKNQDNLYICTDKPHEAEAFFND